LHPITHNVEHTLPTELIYQFVGLDNLVSNTEHQAIVINVQHVLTAQHHYGFLSKEGGISIAKEIL